MHDVLSDREWLEFVQAYDDRRIVYPSGARVRFGQQLNGESWEIEDDVRLSREFRPFVIALGWANYACGVWGNTATEANFAIREDGRTDWVSPWPGEINTRESATSGRRYRVAAILTDPGSVDVDFDLNVERRESRAASLGRLIPTARFKHRTGVGLPSVAGCWRALTKAATQCRRRLGVAAYS
jgi:hypothetical protein